MLLAVITSHFPPALCSLPAAHRDCRFIAGVTNPLFESKGSWFDVLCIVGDAEGSGVVGAATSIGGASSSFSAAAVAGAAGPPPTAAAAAAAIAAPVASSVTLTPSGEAFFAAMRTPAAKDADAALWARLRSGARFGEHWLRQTLQAHAHSTVQLAGLHDVLTASSAASPSGVWPGRSAADGLRLPGVLPAGGSSVGLDRGRPLDGLASPVADSLTASDSTVAVAAAAVAPGSSNNAAGDTLPALTEPPSVATILATTAAAEAGAVAASTVPRRSSTIDPLVVMSPTADSTDDIRVPSAAEAAGAASAATSLFHAFPLLISGQQRLQVAAMAPRLRVLTASRTYLETRRQRAVEDASLSGNLAGSEDALGIRDGGATAGRLKAAASSGHAKPVDCALLRSIARLLKQEASLRGKPGEAPAPAAGSTSLQPSFAAVCASVRAAAAAADDETGSIASDGQPTAPPAVAALDLRKLPLPVKTYAAGTHYLVAKPRPGHRDALRNDIAALLGMEGATTELAAPAANGAAAASAAAESASAAAGVFAEAAAESTAAPAPAAPFQGDATVLYSRLAEALRDNADAQTFFVSLLLADGTTAGLHSFACGLFHASQAVRACTATVLQELRSHPWPPLRLCWATLNPMMQTAALRRSMP